MYKHYTTSVGNNLKHIQITTKYCYRVMNQPKLRTFCRIAIKEACKKHNIKIEIIEVLEKHVHLVVDCPRTLSDAKLIQVIKGFSARVLFLIYPNFRDIYPRGHFWNAGYFCTNVGEDFERVFEYVKNQ